MEKRIIFTFIIAAVLACAFLFVKIKYNVDKSVPVIVISQDTIYAGQSISFADSAMAATKYEWNFGDQSGISVDQNGTHQYKIGGNYTISLKYNINANMVYDKTVVVLTKPVEIDTSQFEIDCPAVGFVKQPLTFKAIVKDKSATLFEWRFGESGTIDSHDKNATYSFSKPDSYEISLRVNNSKRFVKKTISIKERIFTPCPPISAELLENLFQQYLDFCNDDNQRNAQKKKIMGYFSGLNNSYVDENDNKIPIHEFLRDICLENKKSVKVIRMTKDKNSGCVNLIEVVTQ